MPSATEYRQRVAHKLNAFPMPAVTDYPDTNAAGGKPGYSDGSIDDAVTDAAAAVLNAIAAMPGHPLRAQLEAPVAVTNNSLLPSHSGPVGGVTIDGKPGRLDSPNGVQRERDNPCNSTLNNGLYGFKGNRIVFTGTTCTVDLVQVVAPVDPADVPESAAEAVVDKALAVLFAFDGGKLEAAMHFDKLAQEALQLIGITSQMPETVPYTPA